MTFTAERLVPGRRQGTRCVAPTRRNRTRPRVPASAPAGGAVKLALPAGDNVLGFSGRLFEVLGPATTGSSPSPLTAPGTGRPRGAPRSRCSEPRRAERGPAKSAC